MMQKQSIDKIYAVIGSVLLGIMTGFYVVIFLYTEDFVIRSIVIGFSMMMLLTYGCLVALLRKRIVGYFELLHSCIDDMVADKKNISFDLESETLISKFSYKLQRLYEMLQNSKNQIKEEKKSIQKIVSDIAHQVKTPLANLKMYHTTLMERQLPIEKQQEFQLLMETQIEKLEFLIQTMIKLSRLETGIIELSVQPALIYETLGLALGGIVLHAERKQIEVVVDCDDSLMVLHDKKWTAEALFNMLDNSIKYTQPGGKITVKVVQWETVTKIDITDTGKGIQEEHLAQIFKRFYREECANNVEGVGIGLYLCREIITRQGGYIQVHSEVGKGTTFTVFLLHERQL